MDHVVDRLYLSLGLDSAEIEKGLQAAENAIAAFLRGITQGIAEVGGPQLTEPFNAAVGSAAAAVTEAERLMADGAAAASESISGAERQVAEGAAAIGTNVSEAEKKISDGARRAGNTLGNLENKIAHGLKNIMTNFVAPLAAVFAGTKIFGDYTQGAKFLGAFSDSIGENIENLQAWGSAVTNVGGNMSEFQQTLKGFSANMAEIYETNTGGLKPYFEKLGISVKTSSGAMRSSFDIMRDIAAKFEKMGKAESFNLGRKFVFDVGTIRLLQGGVKNLDEMLARERDLAVYTKRDTEIAGRFGAAIDALKQSFKALSAIAMRVVVPALTWIAEKMTKVVVFLRENELFVKTLLIWIASFIGVKLVAAIKTKLIPALISLKATMLANPMTWIFIAIATAVAAVILLVEDLMVYLRGGDSLIGEGWKEFYELLEKMVPMLKLVHWVLEKINGLSKKGADVGEAWKNGSIFQNMPSYAAGAGARPAASPPTIGGVGYGPLYDRNRDNTAITVENNGDVIVNTQATDPQGVANEVAKVMRRPSSYLTGNTVQLYESGVNP